MERREFLAKSVATGASLTLLSACGGGDGSPVDHVPEMPAYNGPDPFRHGVASGDPLARRAVLWTRLSAKRLDDIPVIVEVSRNPQFQPLIYQGVAHASAEHDFTVKIDPLLPTPETTYYYRFRSLGYTSPIGRTRTAPSPGARADRLRFAVVSCSNFPYGYFNAYARIADRPDLDAVLHLGDYIYEYEQGQYNDPELAEERPVDPPHEIVTLDDYRRRYACYREDPDLQECHRQHPFISVWDDHEFANNAWRGGAENHDPGEGSWAERKRAAAQAYYEWMPIREEFPDRYLRIYRRFDYGKLLTLMMLDTRIIGRHQQPDVPAESRDPDRLLLGRDQREWLFNQLEYSDDRGARWHVLGQQVMFSPLTLGTLPEYPELPLSGGVQLNLDQWDGYQVSRNKVLNEIQELQLDNTVVLTGDIHSSWAMDVSDDPGNPLVYNRFTGEGSLAVEYVTPAVSSPGAPTEEMSDIARAILLPLNPHMKWVELYNRGYVVLDLTHERCKADWYHLYTVSERDDREFFARSFLTRGDGRNHLEEASQPSEPKSDPPALAPALRGTNIIQQAT